MKDIPGIDVSEHNGKIEWDKVKDHIHFAMLRGGYGRYKVDARFVENVVGCQANKIPFGVYWFSYALNKRTAEEEAQKCLETIKGLNVTYPVAFDFEYDSHRYARENGININGEQMCVIADTFLSIIAENGYTPMLYTNVDYYNKGFKKLCGKYKVWLAEWGALNPSIPCLMWQDSSQARIEGIVGPVDADLWLGEQIKDGDDAVANVHAKFNEKYDAIAVEILNGKWSNGEERVKKLKAAELDYRYAQALVNAML